MKANVNQKQRPFPIRPNPVGKKNLMDLRHNHVTTFTMGKLIPFLTLETLPGDEFFIRGEFMFRFAPLYLPIMHRVNTEMTYIYCPWRIIWPDSSSEGLHLGWESFIFQTGTGNTLAHPVVQYDPTNVTAFYGELPQYMGYPTLIGSPTGPFTTDQHINAGPLAAYYMYWDNFERNTQIQDEIFEPLEAGLAQSWIVAEQFKCRYRNWTRDNYTSATPSPQMGAQVQVPMVDFQQVNVEFGGQRSLGPYAWAKRADGTSAGLGDLVTDASGDTEHSVTGNDLYLDIQSTAASILQLRFALQMQEFLELSMRAGDRYPDRMDAWFNVDPSHGTLSLPQHIKTMFGKVMVSEVLSTADTTAYSLGGYAGQALVLDSTKGMIKYRCEEHGFLLGIVSVYPDSSYMQGKHRMWDRSDPLEYAWEQFAHIGDVAILNQEVQMAFSTALQPWNTQTFGYLPRYFEYRYQNDIYSGLMRTTFTSFTLGRIFDPTDPESTMLNSEFLECRPRITDVFVVAEDEDEIYAYIYNDVMVNRRLPKFGVPGL